MSSIRTTLARVTFVPVLTVEDPGVAADLAAALVAGGLPVIEVTLRTTRALDAIRAMTAVPGAIVGAGTVLTPEDLTRARDAGARFAVSPGQTPALFDAARRAAIDYLPGAVTASEVMAARDAGFTTLKFFPANTMGGPLTLQGFAPVFADVVFCPTGKIGRAEMAGYLAEPNVICVGGTWVAPADKVAARDWAAIEALSRDAAAVAKLYRAA